MDHVHLKPPFAFHTPIYWFEFISDCPKQPRKSFCLFSGQLTKFVGNSPLKVILICSLAILAVSAIESLLDPPMCGVFLFRLAFSKDPRYIELI